MVATAEIKINLVPRQTLSGLGCLCSNLQVQGNLNVLILVGSFWSWKHFVSRNCPFQRHCRQSALSQPGILCFPVPRDASARCGRYCAIPFTGGRSHKSRFVAGVLLPALILPAPLLGIHLSSGRSDYTHPYMTVSRFLSFLFCAAFSRIHSMTSSLISLTLKPVFATVFICSHALHHLICAFTDVITTLTMNIILLVWMHMSQCIPDSLFPFLRQDIFTLAFIS